MKLTRESLLKLPNFHGSAVGREPAKNFNIFFQIILFNYSNFSLRQRGRQRTCQELESNVFRPNFRLTKLRRIGRVLNCYRIGCFDKLLLIRKFMISIIMFYFSPDGVELNKGLEGVDQLRMVPVGRFRSMTENHH